ncbi:amino acid racemase [Oceanobacillus iheyensis HTE831]|uniref:Amino acid racemase n=1 Tax=Oceanobacillus iheyensis (strain DSM 14371 / CIP 107618 / JCM 11309 / KCTC 3954 / HTE831) TaxID=221109 RepID=Q8EL40_OCEIH|nr:aspartate/glutamate racemase family protein [Oceanobacillus iheyensis]BAC15347.1 amino acid racemase [Oceanobacillus iheyensis HTE831]
MKTIGLIGGMSWESSSEYYRIINEEVKARLGGLHSAKCILYSVDFADIERDQSLGDWKSAGHKLAHAAHSLEKAGADFIIICTNTMHKTVEDIEKAISIPILHIADATATKIKSTNINTIGLLGTTYTMQHDFYKNRIKMSGINVIIPDSDDINKLNKIIFEELCLGIINEQSKAYYISVINNLMNRGAEGIIFGCTEIGLLIQEKELDIPIFDTTKIHALDAVNIALKMD